MSDEVDRSTQAPIPPPGDGESQRGRARRSGQRKGPRLEDPVEERRHRPKSGDRSGSNGFRDGLEHASCVAMRFIPSPTGVITARAGVATMARPIVARREGAVLQCDLQHGGPHIWPDGEIVAQAVEAFEAS